MYIHVYKHVYLLASIIFLSEADKSTLFISLFIYLG